MVLSIRAHELLTQNSKYNSIQNDFKSLIPKNDIPDKKQVYHKNMLEISEKTIELKSKKTFKKREEIVIDKVEVEEEEVEEESDDLEDVQDTLQFKLDEDSEDEDSEVKKDVEVEEDKVEEEEGEGEGEVEDECDDKKLNDNLMLDLIGIIEEKNKKDKKEDKEEPVEINIKEDNSKKIVLDIPDNMEQSGGNVKRIKLDQHYNFF